MSQKHFDPSAAPALVSRDHDDSESDGDSVNLVEKMNSMSLDERRRVYALQHLFNHTKALRVRMHEELAKLDLERKKRMDVLFDMRRKVVSGERDVTKEELAGLPPLVREDADAPAAGAKKAQVVDPNDAARLKVLKDAAQSSTGGIPHFWLTCFQHSDILATMISERDAPVLAHLIDVHTTFVNNNPLEGIHIHFMFEPNQYFPHSELHLQFLMELDEDSNETVVVGVKGQAIEWTSAESNPTVVVKSRKQRNKKTKEMRVVQREEPCPSFFQIFKVVGEGEDEEEEDEDMFEAMDMNIEAGQAIISDIVPCAAFYYSGRSVDATAKSLMESCHWGMGGDDDDEEDDEDEEEESGAAAGAKGGKPGAKAPDCKQQ